MKVTVANRTSDNRIINFVQTKYTGVVLLLLAGLLLSGCAAGDFGPLTNQAQREPQPVVIPTDTPAPTATDEPTEEPTPEPTEEPTLEPTSPAEKPLPRGGVQVGGSADLERLIERAKAKVASATSASAEQISVVSTERVEWNDSSLGCPKPGQMYAQVITPGYRILLDANGSTFEFHSGLNGEGPLVECN